MKNEEKIYALIYNRVSSLQQESDGSGLDSQEHRCISYAQARGYDVSKERVFHDTYTGGGDFMKRPAMRELLSYIDNNPGERYVVIFDDLKRFARDTKFHIELRGVFNSRKVGVECLNFNFEDTPEGVFVETILAAQNQLEREQNQRQVIQKQKSRLEAGYWAFHSPMGYKMQKVAGYSGKVALPIETASILKEALEGYANMRFVYLSDMVQFLKDNNVLGNLHNDRYLSTAGDLLRNPFYAGYIEYKPWGVTKRKGVHEAIIDDTTYLKNIERLSKPAIVKRVRKDDHEAFSLRRLINCGSCKKPFTAAFSKGRGKQYGYYFCQNPECVMYKKSVPKKHIEDDFRIEMEKLIPSNSAIRDFERLFDECWQEAARRRNDGFSQQEGAIKAAGEQIEKFLNLAAEAQSPLVRARYEQKVEELDKELKSLQEKSLVKPDLAVPYRTAFEKVAAITKSPYKLWTSVNPAEKKKLFYFFFEDNIEYDAKSRYRTVKPSILYRSFDEISKNSADVDKVSILSNRFEELYLFILKWGGVLDSLKIRIQGRRRVTPRPSAPPCTRRSPARSSF